MTNPPPGYGYPSDPQNPYGQQPPAQPGYGAPQGPYDPLPPQQGAGAYGAPPPADYGQQPGYGTPPPPGYGAQQPGYGATPPPGYGYPPGMPQQQGTLAQPLDRFLARLIDAAILLIPVIVLENVLGIYVGAILAGAVWFGYEALMMLTQNQQTIGKKALKLRVVSATHGGRPADNELWARSAVYGLPQAVYCIGTIFFLVNVLSLLWDKPLQQCFHDKAGKTVVVKEA
ncbi:RDD family protein [Kitasatospora viridis]|uniref:Putative RDD family membrane protein YckC n=1 Tax=Kitasatospora viridis TaxID=281105 RepID=A0A561UMC6_9ACTN|nr:RDD family protein [Kitasatospora viridis]TWG00484.1 putative RDD family membrane protein YckC [Kitasatospora viridis]